MALTAAEIEQLAINAATRAAKAEVEEAAEKAATAAAEKVSLNHEEITKLVAEAVRQTLLQMGVDSSDPIAMQRDFQHLRAWRESGEEIKKKGLMVLTGIFVTGLFSLIVMGVVEWAKKVTH